MARRCTICGKGPKSGHKVSHSNVKTKRRWLPNLQRVRIQTSSGPRRSNVCTECLRSGRVERAI